jgi:hypothetical protein
MRLPNLYSLTNQPAELFEIKFPDGSVASVYPKSITKHEEVQFFLAKTDDGKFLCIVTLNRSNNIYADFEGSKEFSQDKLYVKICPLTTINRRALQRIFPFTRPQLIGKQNSFGFGDRLGLANPGHLKALSGSTFKPVLAQQSIRELTRTRRRPEEVMDAAVWAILQEGYYEGFGADADHLKTTDDIDLMVKAGFNMFTIDPGDYVDNQVDHLSLSDLEPKMDQIPWEDLDDSRDFLEKRYLDKKFKISKDFYLHPSKIELYRALIKYGNALAHIKHMATHLLLKHPQHHSEIEISVDETESVTTPFEHFFFASELKRLNVPFVSLAPRFIGSFEKGVDYRGDLNVFTEEYLKHVRISQYFGSYKISLHSGSDKFTVYKIIGSLKEGNIHVKTAGTSYLEALKVLAAKEPEFFRKILDFSREIYETEKKSYHVSAELSKVPAGNECSDSELTNLFQNANTRQVLHVTFGRILTEEKPEGGFLFRDEILRYLKRHEVTYDQFLVEHFKKHLEPFKQ